MWLGGPHPQARCSVDFATAHRLKAVVGARSKHACIVGSGIVSIHLDNLNQGALCAKAKEENVKGLIMVFCIAGLLTAPSLSLAHPHFDKSVNATLPSGAEATIAYQTVPSNEAHATGAAVGSFITPRNPSFTLSAEITAGSVTVPAGEYTIGVIKNGDADWTMALYKGTPPRGAAPDMAQMIKLDSMYSTDEGAAEHLLIDITPGTGEFEGKSVLTLHFGTMYLTGALS